MRVAFTDLILGASLTAVLWLLMRPAFGLFLSINQNYGAIFGGMKTMFVSITWLYLNFAVFLLGTELISTLRKKDVLLLKGLFDSTPNKANYIDTLMRRYGHNLKKGEYVFEIGNTERNLYYLVEGNIVLSQKENVIRTLVAGDYFGDLSMLTKQPTTSDAIVSSEEAKVIVIYADNIDAMLEDDPKIAMELLKQMARRLQTNFN